MLKQIICMLLLVSNLFVNFGQNNYSNAISIAANYSTDAEEKAKDIEDNINSSYPNSFYISAGEEQWNILERRHKKSYHYVTYEVGKVLNDQGDGKTYNFRESDYISYRSVKGVKTGDCVLTYFVWCNDCNCCDDVIARFDVVLKK